MTKTNVLGKMFNGDGTCHVWRAKEGVKYAERN